MPLPQYGVAQNARQRVAVYLAFDQIILRSKPHCLLGDILVGKSGHYDYGDVWRGTTDDSQAPQPLTVGKREVQENNVDIAVPEPSSARLQVLHPLDAEPRAQAFGEHRPYQSGISRIVLNEKDSRRSL